MKNKTNYKVTKSMIKINIICSLLWMLNVIIRLFKHPDDKLGMIIWGIGALLFALAAFNNYRIYKDQSSDFSEDKEM